MAKRYRRKPIPKTMRQKQYRERLRKYEEYKTRTGKTEVSFKEWNAPYRETRFLRREYKHYSDLYDARAKSSRYGFRDDREGNTAQKYSYKEFKQYYFKTRNSLEEEVEMGERERVGSVITEMVNDQAYELSAKKAKVLADYLLENEREALIKKGIIIPNAIEGENGELVDLVKSRNLRLLIRQGSFIRDDIGLWDDIKTYYKQLIANGKTTKEARDEIGITYFHSDPSKK